MIKGDNMPEEKHLQEISKYLVDLISVNVNVDSLKDDFHQFNLSFMIKADSDVDYRLKDLCLSRKTENESS